MAARISEHMCIYCVEDGLEEFCLLAITCTYIFIDTSPVLNICFIWTIALQIKKKFDYDCYNVIHVYNYIYSYVEILSMVLPLLMLGKNSMAYLCIYPVAMIWLL